MRTIGRLSAIAAMLGSAALLAGAASPAPKKGFAANIEDLTESNADFRRVLYTGKNLQLVLMAIAPGGLPSGKPRSTRAFSRACRAWVI
jgi:hypothetical protein